MATLRYVTCGLLLLGSIHMNREVLAQSSDSPTSVTGRTVVANWPLSRIDTRGNPAPPLNDEDYDLLPFIDTLSVHYDFSIDESDSSRIRGYFEIEWTPGEGGIVLGNRVSTRQLPTGIAIESIDIAMQVLVSGEPMARFVLPVTFSHSNKPLGPSPDLAIIDALDLGWESIFSGVQAAAAKQIFENGFELADPRIARVTFVTRTRSDWVAENSTGSADADAAEPDTVDTETFEADTLETGAVGTRASNENTTYDLSEPNEFMADLDLWIAIRNDAWSWRPSDNDIRIVEQTPRRGMGRSSSNDERRSPHDRDDAESLSSTDHDRPSRGGKADRDDDEDRLLPTAILGVAAVGGVAILGGTIGYFGSASTAPIGVMSGYVQKEGGFLLQVAVNRQVFGRASGPENMIVSITSFYDTFDFPIAPAVGLGARITEEGTNGVTWKPNVSFGLAGRIGPIVLLAGYDVTTPDFRFGTAINFRHTPQRMK